MIVLDCTKHEMKLCVSIRSLIKAKWNIRYTLYLFENAYIIKTSIMLTLKCIPICFMKEEFLLIHVVYLCLLKVK